MDPKQYVAAIKKLAEGKTQEDVAAQLGVPLMEIEEAMRRRRIPQTPAQEPLPITIPQVEPAGVPNVVRPPIPVKQKNRKKKVSEKRIIEEIERRLIANFLDVAMLQEGVLARSLKLLEEEIDPSPNMLACMMRIGRDSAAIHKSISPDQELRKTKGDSVAQAEKIFAFLKDREKIMDDRSVEPGLEDQD